MKRAIITGTLLLLPSCADPQDDNLSLEPPVLVAVSPEEIERKERERMASLNAYNERLKTAPIYGSKIRSYLIKNPDKYRSAYRRLIGDFRQTGENFRCVHSESVIAALSRTGWDLVNCDRYKAVFLKAHGMQIVQPSSRCTEYSLRLEDKFETIELYFKTDQRPWSSIADVSKSRILSTFVISRLSGAEIPTDLEQDIVRFGVGSTDRKVDFAAKDGIAWENLHVFDSKFGSISTYMLSKRQVNPCLRSVETRAVVRDMLFRFDHPVIKYDQLSQSVEGIVTALEASAEE